MPSSIRDRFLEEENNYICNINFSRIWRRNDFISSEDDDDIISSSCIPPSSNHSITNINDLDRDYFWRKLVENFLIKLSRRDIY